MNIKGKGESLNAGKPGGGATPNKANANVDINDLMDVTCDYCDNKTFRQVRIIKKISKLVSPQGKESYFPVPVFKCDECGHINEEFIDFDNE